MHLAGSKLTPLQFHADYLAGVKYEFDPVGTVKPEVTNRLCTGWLPVVYVQLNRAVISNWEEVLARGRTVGLEYNHLAFVLVLTLPEETIETGLVPADADVN